MNRIVFASNDVLGNGPRKGSRVRDASCKGKISQHKCRASPEPWINSQAMVPTSPKLSSSPCLRIRLTGLPEVGFLRRVQISQRFVFGGETLSLSAHQVILITVPAFSVPPSGYEMGFGFPITPVEVGGAPDGVVDWVETRDAKAENAKTRVEVKRIFDDLQAKNLMKMKKLRVRDGL